VTVRAVADAALRRSPAQLVSRRAAARRLAVLAYHGVDDAGQFARQLDLLVERTRPVDLDAVLDAVHGRARLPERALLVTFDDGHRSVLERGLPLLRERGIPAVLFVLPGVVGTDRPFWWTEVTELVRVVAPSDWSGTDPADLVRRLKQLPDDDRRSVVERLRGVGRPAMRQPQLRADELQHLQESGVEIGNHTWSHPCLDRCDDDVLRAEIRKAHLTLTDVLGRPPRVFAYPNGNWDGRAERELQRLGYRAAFLFDHRLTRLTTAHPLRLSRLRVNSDSSLNRLATIVSGLHPVLHHARGGV
jgi:peptidoglycan/xylan/chitin deacetylase (PgdA/CDA1 family)